MINRKLILDNAPSNIGEQIHINHAGCSAGEDRKRRLYIKRTDKGIIAYCHHCSEHGFAQEGLTARYAGHLASPTKAKEDRKVLPDLGSLSPTASLWLTRYHCNSEDLNFVGIKDAPSKVGLCIFNVEGEHIGYQVRNLIKGAVPKYTTLFFSNEDNKEGAWFKGTQTLVITEDYLSAYRINRDTGLSSLALLRTTMTDKLLFKVCEMGYNKIYIWLDPDQAGVEGANKLYKQLSYYLPSDVETQILKRRAGKEPKECTPTELKEIF